MNDEDVTIEQEEWLETKTHQLYQSLIGEMVIHGANILEITIPDSIEIIRFVLEAMCSKAIDKTAKVKIHVGKPIPKQQLTVLLGDIDLGEELTDEQYKLIRQLIVKELGGDPFGKDETVLHGS